MGSSNRGGMTTGGVEDLRHNPKLFVDHTRALCPNQEEIVNKLGYTILKVPEYRCLTPTTFSPRGWRFGLHNRENLDNSGSEAVKLVLAVQYGLVEKKWVHFRDTIVDEPRAMLACYGLQDGARSWTDEQIKHVLALDALFLATFIDMMFPKSMRRLWAHNTLPSGVNATDEVYARYSLGMEVVHLDLCRVENQIPLVLIDEVVEYFNNSDASQTSKSNEPFIDDLQYYQQRSVEYMVMDVASCFIDASGEAFKTDSNSSPFGERMHILGAAYEIICGSKGLLMNKKGHRDEYIHVLSATKLIQSSIKIVGVHGPLCSMSYKMNCLSLPKMRITDEIVFFLQNMAWYESNTVTGGCLFHDYILLMCDLIQAPEDLDLLTKHGVINNACGTIKGFEMWMALQEGLMQIPSSEEHHVRKVAIVNRCGR